MEKRVLLLFGLFIFLAVLNCGECASSNDVDFSIVLFPDTQNMVTNYPSIWETMPNWVVTHETANNIQAVLGMGDISDNNANSEFAEAVKGWNLVKNAGIIYVPVRGNHDSSSTPFNTYFGPSYFSGKSWYGGSADGTTNNNYYVKFDVGAHKYLDIAFGYAPSSSALSWAQGIINANPDREVIVSTHSYLDVDGTRTIEGDTIWNNLVKNNQRIFLVVSGHMHGGTVYSTSKGSSGKTVNQVLCDYQAVGKGGDGYVCILKFQPSQGKIALSTYSAYLSKYDSSAAKTMPYTPICTPNTCTSLGYDCGTVSDGCGGTLSCGTCSANQVCSNGRCITNNTGTSNVTNPKTCKVNTTCSFTINGCSNGLVFLRNQINKPIDYRQMIVSGDFPVTFFLSSPYTKSFVPTSSGTVGTLMVCFSGGQVGVNRASINIVG